MQARLKAAAATAEDLLFAGDVQHQQHVEMQQKSTDLQLPLSIQPNAASRKSIAYRSVAQFHFVLEFLFR